MRRDICNNGKELQEAYLRKKIYLIEGRKVKFPPNTLLVIAHISYRRWVSLQKTPQIQTVMKSRYKHNIQKEDTIQKCKLFRSSLRCHDLTEKSCLQPQEVNLAKKSKALHLQADTNEEGIKAQYWHMSSASLVTITWKQHYCASREHTFYGIPDSEVMEE